MTHIETLNTANQTMQEKPSQSGIKFGGDNVTLNTANQAMQVKPSQSGIKIGGKK